MVGGGERRETLGGEWLTLEEAAAYLRVSKPTIYRLCAEHHLPFYKLAGVGGRRFKRADLDALLQPGHGSRTSTQHPSPGASVTAEPSTNGHREGPDDRSLPGG